MGEYAIAYSTKAEGTDASAPVLDTLEQLQQRKQQRRHAPGTDVAQLDPIADRGRWMLARAANAAHGTQTLPLTMASLLASRGSAIWESHQYAIHDLRHGQPITCS